MNKNDAKSVIAAQIHKRFDSCHSYLLEDQDYDILLDILTNKLNDYTKYLDLFDEHGEPVDHVSEQFLSDAKYYYYN